jgi:hypothetical protein
MNRVGTTQTTKIMKENQALRGINHQKQIADREADRAVVAHNNTVPMPAQISSTFFSAPSVASSVVVSNPSLEMSSIEKAHTPKYPTV